jgi:CheY-like chemotaxis protein
MNPTPTIMVIDDEQVVLKYLKKVLERHGYNTITAENGKESLQILENQQDPPDLIISDINMPEMDGYSFYETLTQDLRWRFIPFVFASGLSHPDDIRLAKKLGVDDYLTKPINVEDLLAVVEGKIKRSRMLPKLTPQMEKVINDPKIVKKGASLSEEQTNLVHLMLIGWDPVLGPNIIVSIPKSEESLLPYEEIRNQIFTSATVVYGCSDTQTRDSTLIHLANVDMDAFILFDNIDNPDFPGEKQQGLLVAIAPKITYIDSIALKTMFNKALDEFCAESTPDWDKLHQEIITELKRKD